LIVRLGPVIASASDLELIKKVWVASELMLLAMTITATAP
jgi:hypothetical protein